ncbi:MAG: hypothetical protein KDD55_08195, partial [Bdellovibrionales bacterium]|nr:hypothetical protein [Bdellovibrionales bacterium]
GDTSFMTTDRTVPLILFLFSTFGIIFSRTPSFFPLKSTLRKVPLSPFLVGVLLVFCFDWLTRPYNLIQGPNIRGEIILFALIAWLFLRRQVPWGLPIITICSLGLLAGLLLHTTGEGILFSDDNATFLYRFALLKENFPHIPFYGPLWNAGIEVRDFFATGALNVFLLFSPLFALFQVENIYNIVVTLLLFGILPLSLYTAASIEGLGRTGRWFAALLAPATSLLWYRWALQYGTLGFITSASLLPLNAALIIRFLHPERSIKLWHAIIAILSITLMLLWSLSGIALLPLILSGIVYARTYFAKRYAKLIFTALFLLNLPWIIIFWQASQVSTFLHSEKKVSITQPETPSSSQNLPKAEDKKERITYKHKAGGINLKKSLSLVREYATSHQPLLWLLFLPGVMSLRRRSRVMYLLLAGWLFFLGAFLPPVKPQLELDRMLIFLGLLACIPAGRALERAVAKAKLSSVPFRLGTALAVGFVFAGIISAGAVVRKRTLIPFSVAERSFGGLPEALEKHYPGGRILFTGFLLHDFMGGHIAPLAHFTKLPLVASSPVHNMWKYQQVFPKEFLARGNEGIQEYLDVYNVSLVLTHEKRWREKFLADPEHFQEIWRSKDFVLFQRTTFPQSYFLQGKGEVLKQTSHSVTLRVDTTSVVLKFHYLPFLKSSQCSIKPYAVSSDISFIQLDHCASGSTLTLEAKGPSQRFFGGIL